MASGDISASTPTVCATVAEVEAALDALNLAAVTDNVHVVPISNPNSSGLAGNWIVFKTEREA